MKVTGIDVREYNMKLKDTSSETEWSEFGTQLSTALEAYDREVRRRLYGELTKQQTLSQYKSRYIMGLLLLLLQTVSRRSFCTRV